MRDSTFQRRTCALAMRKLKKLQGQQERNRIRLAYIKKLHRAHKAGLTRGYMDFSSQKREST